MKGVWNNDNDMSEKFFDIAKAERGLLSSNGFCNFGMVCTEDGEELGLCYQKDGNFIFVDYGGAETKRPLLISKSDNKWEFYSIRLLRDNYKHRSILLYYNKEELIYTTCHPSCVDYSSIYIEEYEGEYYLLTSQNECLELNLRGYSYFEYIDKPSYIHLCYHTIDDEVDFYDNRYNDYFSEDVFYVKKTNELFKRAVVVNYKDFKIINSQEPKCTVLFDENMTEIYRKDECAVFCKFGHNAFLIFEDSQIAYEINTNETKKLEGLEEYDNYDIGLDYLIRHRIITKQAEEYEGELTLEGQIVETIPKHHESDVYVYDSDLNEVGRLHVIGLFEDVVNKKGRILIGFTLDDDSSQCFYYDINDNNEKEYDEEYKGYFSIPILIENLE